MNVDDNHISAAKAYAAKLIADPAALERLLAEHPELVPKEPERDVLTKAIYAMPNGTTMTPERVANHLRAELAKHGYAVCKVATDEERLIEARELCAKVVNNAVLAVWTDKYLTGSLDYRPEMIAMVAALKARDGVA